jgi:hypothetical protein
MATGEIRWPYFLLRIVETVRTCVMINKKAQNESVPQSRYAPKSWSFLKVWLVRGNLNLKRVHYAAVVFGPRILDEINYGILASRHGRFVVCSRGACFYLLERDVPSRDIVDWVCLEILIVIPEHQAKDGMRAREIPLIFCLGGLW